MSELTATYVSADEHGDVDVLRLREEQLPEPGPGQVRLEVRAIGVNPIDLKVRQGMRGNADGPFRLGYEVAGVVEAVGPDVTQVTVGEEVIAFRIDGGYASALIVPAADVVPKPAALPWPEAAGLLLAGVTAVHALEVTGVGEGDVVLLHGAAGAVGQAVIQLALLRGARVIGTASAHNHDLLRSLGAVPVAYGEGVRERIQAAAADTGAPTASIDAAGTEESLATSLDLVGRERSVTVVVSPRSAEVGIQGIGGAPGADPGTEIRNAARAPLAQLAGEGKLAVRVVREFPLSEVREAHRFVAENHAAGKVILLP
ncbi:NADP-dependent oxidoreductase [Nocardioides sp. BP30]|uniref:quinone oxidoreductase family protein n=1 Tax=Nocardioides sp. BP30 TaxID=3036374 RepID=UPI002468C9F7|nr:NADP-dependent oxidoreductase [Nocardioides sp. BP30]WGL53834.1 NADP-dependent oxidoreductase [Nocardioides sp. BP30]